MNASRQPHIMTSEFNGKTGDILHRLQALHPTLIDLSLGRLEDLLEKLGHPERLLPPVIHVAGTNGKGSTCAMLRAIAEQAGLCVHVMTSPHLLSVTERFRLAGELVSEDQLNATLEEIEHINQGAAITVFEVLTAAGFLLFSRTPADLAIIEVGLGGRYDATNVLPTAQVCVITPISLDHQAFLGDTLTAIAHEKAGIIKQNVPVISGIQDKAVHNVLRHEAARQHAPLHMVGHDIMIHLEGNSLIYQDPLGTLTLPVPALAGPHQHANAAQAVAALRLGGFTLPTQAFFGIAHTTWPARLQSLHGTLRAMLPEHWSLILDGGHNPGAGEALAQQFQTWHDQPLHLIVGLKDSKDASGFLRPLLPFAHSLYAVAEPQQHLAMSIEAIQHAAAQAGGNARPGPTVREALSQIVQQAAKTHAPHEAPPARVIICGSLYLAGCVLAQDGFETH